MRNGVIATGLLALALAGTACGEGGKATPESQGGGGPYRQPSSAPPGGSPSGSASSSVSAAPSESASVSPSESASAMPATGPATVDARKTSLGMILTDGKGRSVYLFEKDTNGKPTCADACLKEWPPFLTEGKPVAGSGVKSSWLSTVTWPDGKTQVTYNGHPLYYYAGDKAAGDMKGQGVSSFGGKWYVVGADTGAALGTAGASGAPSGSPSGMPSGSPSGMPSASPTG